jgi:hypothetical protein
MIWAPSSPGLLRSFPMFARSAPSSTTRTGLISRLGNSESVDDACEAMAASPLRGFVRWPAPSQPAEHREGGVTYYNKSRGVDEPLILTHADRKWIVASFMPTTGNVWCNPEITSQHFDRKPRWR